MLAAKHDLLYLMNLLLNAGAAVDAADEAGNTAMHYAYAFGQHRVAHRLEEAGGNNVCVAVVARVGIMLMSLFCPPPSYQDALNMNELRPMEMVPDDANFQAGEAAFMTRRSKSSTATS